MNRPFAAALPVFALLSSTAIAHTPPPAPMQRVEVSGSAALDARRTDTAGRLTVNRDELIRYGDSTLSGVLKRQPGISVTNCESRQRGRGAGSTQSLVNGAWLAQGVVIDMFVPSPTCRV